MQHASRIGLYQSDFYPPEDGWNCVSQSGMMLRNTSITAALTHVTAKSSKLTRSTFGSNPKNQEVGHNVLCANH